MQANGNGGAALAEVAVQDGPTEEASALPQDPGQTKIRRKLLSQTRLIGESPTVGQVYMHYYFPSKITYSSQIISKTGKQCAF